MLDIAIKSILRHKVRSFLTILGITLGIGLILILGSIGAGLNAQIQKQVGSVAAIITVRATDNDIGISEDTIEGIKYITGVEAVVPIANYRITRVFRGREFGFMSGRQLFSGGGIGRLLPSTSGGIGATTLTFTAINPEDLDYIIGEKTITLEGRKFDETDNGKEVVLLGYNQAELQNLNIGDEIEYQRRTENSTDIESFFFEVIGILEQTGDSNIDNAAYVPLKTMQEIENDDTISSLQVRVSDISLVESITEDINNFFDDVRAFSIVTMIRQLESTLSTIQLAVLGIAAVSAIVGSLGVMNTMIMSIMERRKEIGIMKAIGATTTTILIQVLQESAIISFFGGAIGVLVGYIATFLIPKFTQFTAILTLDLIVLGLGFALILGILAGIYPAWNASRLDPIEVLRYE
ncbi:MAG: FtsX-like permease family protein [Candidatus Altiarchaeota archaeon]